MLRPTLVQWLPVPPWVSQWVPSWVPSRVPPWLPPWVPRKVPGGSPLAPLQEALAQARGWGWRHPKVPPGWEQQFQESWVPLSRQQLQQGLLRDFHPPGPSRASFLAFSDLLDQQLSPQFHQYHQSLQTLFSSVDPEGDPGGSPGGSPEGSPEGSQELVAALGRLLAEGNFQKVPEAAVAFALVVQHPQDEVEVSLQLADYQLIQFWALGQRVGPLPPPPPSPPPRWSYRRPSPPPERHYFHRVVVLAIPQGATGAGLELAAFRNVPLESLELLLGRGRPRPPRGVRTRLHLGLLLWGTLLFLNVGLGALAELKVGAAALLLGMGTAVALRGVQVLSRRRGAAALALAQGRAWHLVAQQRELVAALSRWAQEEATKELLLAHSFLPRLHRAGAPGGSPEALLGQEVEAWLQRRFGVSLSFPAARACRRLRGLEGQLGALGRLPPPPQQGPRSH